MQAQVEELSAKLVASEARCSELHDEVISLRAKMEVMAPLFERMLAERSKPASAPRAPKPAAPDAMDPSAPIHQDTLRRIHAMTVKQRAVMFGIMGGHSYQEIADAMKVDITTVKLHMRAALNKLGLDQKSSLMVQAPMLRELLTKSGAADNSFAFGITLDWMRSPGRNDLDALRPTRKVMPPPGGGNVRKQ